MTWEYVLGIVGGICAIVFGCLTVIRAKKSDDSAMARQDGIILTELGYIKGGVDEIKAEQREQRKTNTEVFSRLTAVEQSAKQAHHRIDRLDGREMDNKLGG